MNNKSKKNTLTTNQLRWWARGISTIWLVVTTIWIVGGFSTEVKRGYSELSFADGGEILLLVLAGILVILLGWWREIIGGTILIISSLGFLVAFLTATKFSQSVLLKGLLICVPFLLSGLLYLIAWRRMRA